MQKQIERYWHGDYRQPLNHNHWNASFVEQLGERWVILAVVYGDGRSCFYSVMLKPERWMTMPKETASRPTDDFTGYTYDNDGPFGYRSLTVAAAKERVYSLCEGLRPVVAAPAPAIVVAPIEVVAAEVVVPKKKRSYQRLSDKEKRERARLRRLEKFNRTR